MPRARYRALTEVDRVDEALDEYHAVAADFPGAEARVRQGILLRMVGRNAEAKVVFNELLLQMKRAPKSARGAGRAAFDRRKAVADLICAGPRHLC
jgi:hypothetical protein